MIFLDVKCFGHNFFFDANNSLIIQKILEGSLLSFVIMAPFLGGKMAANSDLKGVEDDFQVQAEEIPSSSNKGKVIKRWEF